MKGQVPHLISVFPSVVPEVMVYQNRINNEVLSIWVWCHQFSSLVCNELRAPNAATPNLNLVTVA